MAEELRGWRKRKPGERLKERVETRIDLAEGDRERITRLEEQVAALELRLASMVDPLPDPQHLQDNADAAARRVLKQVFDRLDKLEKAATEVVNLPVVAEAVESADNPRAAILAMLDALEMLKERVDALEGHASAKDDLTDAMVAILNAVGELRNVSEAQGERLKRLSDMGKERDRLMAAFANALDETKQNFLRITAA